MIYVDSLRSCIPNRKWRWNKSCHLFADSLEELHEFALKLGLKRSYFQAGSIVPHYDLTKNKREGAVAEGAKEIVNVIKGIPGSTLHNSHRNPEIIIPLKGE